MQRTAAKKSQLQESDGFEEKGACHYDNWGSLIGVVPVLCSGWHLKAPVNRMKYPTPTYQDADSAILRYTFEVRATLIKSHIS